LRGDPIVLRRLAQLAPGLLLAVACLTPHAAQAVEVWVAGSRVNLRAAARANAEVVCQVDEGTVLDAPDGITGEWVKVRAPAHARAWVYGDLLQNGRVRVSAAQVRSGPGINYAVIGRLTEGAVVRVVDSHADGEWLRIEPPAGVMAWISADYLAEARPAPAPQADVRAPDDTPVPSAPTTAPVPAAVEERTGRKPPLPAAGAAASPAPAVSPPAATAKPPRETRPPKRLALDRPQGERVVVEGKLVRSVLVLRRPSRYSIVGRDARGRAETLCYLQGDWQRLMPLIGEEVRAIGIRYWIQGVRYPVVVLEDIATE
jgi:uncharacterized protein YraI